MLSTSIWAILALTVTALPPRAPSATTTSCTTGAPASKHSSKFPIKDFTKVVPACNWTSYAVGGEWYDAHFISGPHYMAFSHTSDPFGAFKCQYTCNAAENCNSFFVWYENVNTDAEHMNCVLFNAVVPESAFVPANSIISGGAYDRLCKSG
ncbi:hypothetical protein QBC35DRAFT_160595 [Podospora australis]|uniref:Apple domain-containing protein n=1 Tax=Podospora australis TaxID=1536484 RepID=A0AAN6X331_9PEZI|nr:hypothetical protein QBC35DRAFT_160595 [Podospora australis]